MSTLQDVYIKLRNDAEFKTAFQKNPIQALKDAGLTLSEKELKMILDQENKSDSSDGPLSGRINK